MPSYTAAVTRKLNEKLGEMPSLLDWGAKVNDSNEYTTEVQRAITEAQDGGFGLTVPWGTINVEGLEITAPIFMAGRGKYGSILKYVGSGEPALLLAGADENNFIGKDGPGIVLSDFQIKSDDPDGVVANLLELAFVSTSEFRNLALWDAGQDAVNIGWSFVLTFAGCDIARPRRDGYRLDKAIHASGLSDDQNAIYWAGGRIAGPYGRGIHLVGGGIMSYVSALTIAACHREAIRLERPYGFLVNGCHMEDNGRETNSDTIVTVGSGSPLNAGFACTIQNSRIYGSGNQVGVSNPFNPSPANTWSVNIDYAYEAIVMGCSFGNSYAGAVRIGASSFGATIYPNYRSAESRKYLDEGVGTVIVGPDLAQQPTIQTTSMMHRIPTSTWRAPAHQTTMESTGDSPVNLFVGAGRLYQAVVIFQSRAKATATISGGVITGGTVTEGGRKYADGTYPLEIEGDGLNAAGYATASGNVIVSITMTNNGSNYTWANLLIPAINEFVLGKQIGEASPAGTDVAFVLHDVINVRNVLEVLRNGDVTLSQGGGSTMVGTRTNDGVSKLASNGRFRSYADIKADSLNLDQPLGSSSGVIVNRKISPTNSDHVDVSGLTNLALVQRNGSVLASVSWSGATGVLHYNGGSYAFSLVSLTADVSGQLPAANIDISSLESAISSWVDGKITTNNEDYYTRGSIDLLFENYYTKDEIDTLLAGKSSSTHVHDFTIGAHTHGGVTTGGGTTASGGDGGGTTEGPS